MSNKRRPIPTKFRYHRPILSDTLPFEVPPIFGNLGYFDFLSRYDVRLWSIGDENYVQWTCNDSSLDLVIKTLFGSSKAPTKITAAGHWPPGYQKSTPRRECMLPRKADWTIPFTFDIAHKERETRRLTVVHPKSQLAVADFYSARAPEILYHTAHSDFSIRHPARIAKTSYFRDSLHAQTKGSPHDSIEESRKEYENLGSYFAYERYSNIFKFYESYQYHNAERKFDKLLKLDISKCFDSIYTHSAGWTVLGSQANKDQLELSKSTFGGEFDRLMQNMNHGETNGIVIGPEFSRIFAEIILQGVDRKLVEAVSQSQPPLTHKVDYQIFRYVDDYFIFYNHSVDISLIERTLGTLLKQVKLSLNRHKSEAFSKPLITPQTIAKDKARRLLSTNIGISVEEIPPSSGASTSTKKRTPYIRTRNLIVEYKTNIHESQVAYSDLLNYTLASIETSVQEFFIAYSDNSKEHKSPDKLVAALIGVLEFCFFVFSASPKVNFSIRLVRIVSSIADGMKSVGLPFDFRHQVLKFAHDNIVRQLKRTGTEKFRYVETMYLLLALDKLGRKYSLDEASLSEYFGLEADGKTYKPRDSLDYFSITVCLMCVKDKVRYANLRSFLEKTIIEIIEKKRAYLASDTESLLLFLDTLSCPFVSAATKSTIAKAFAESQLAADGVKYSATDITTRAVALQTDIGNSSPFWFVNWLGYDLSIALDNKRAREVY